MGMEKRLDRHLQEFCVAVSLGETAIGRSLDYTWRCRGVKRPSSLKASCPSAAPPCILLAYRFPSGGSVARVALYGRLISCDLWTGTYRSLVGSTTYPLPGGKPVRDKHTFQRRSSQPCGITARFFNDVLFLGPGRKFVRNITRRVQWDVSQLTTTAESYRMFTMVSTSFSQFCTLCRPFFLRCSGRALLTLRVDDWPTLRRRAYKIVGVRACRDGRRMDVGQPHGDGYAVTAD